MVSVRFLLVLWLPLTSVTPTISLSVELTPGRPTQLHEAPSVPGGKRAWIITAAGGKEQRPAAADRRRPHTVYTNRDFSVHKLPTVSFGAGTRQQLGTDTNEVQDFGERYRPGGGAKRPPASFLVTSRPFGLSAASGGVQGQPVAVGPAAELPPGLPETTMTWLNTADRYTSVANKRIPTYSLGCRAGQKCSYVLSVPSQKPEPVSQAYDEQKVQNYLQNYQTILEQARNVTSNYVVQKLEPNTRFPTPMEAYQRDQQRTLGTPLTFSTVAPPVRPTAAPSRWPGATPPPRYPDIPRQPYVTIRPTYVHTSLSMVPSGTAGREKGSAELGADYDRAPSRGRPTALDTHRHTTAADQEFARPAPDRYRPAPPGRDRHPFDDWLSQESRDDVRTAAYDRPLRTPDQYPDRYPNRYPDPRPEVERYPDRYPGLGPSRRPPVRLGWPGSFAAGRQDPDRSASRLPADRPSGDAGYPAEDRGSRYPADAARYPAGGPESRYTGLEPQPFSRRGAPAGAPRPRPGDSGYYNSIPSPYPSHGTLPPVIRYRDDGRRRPRGPALSGDRRGPRQLARDGQRPEQGPTARRQAKTTADNRLEPTEQTWGGAGPSSAHSGFSAVKLAQAPAARPAAVPWRVQAASPSGAMPLTGRIFKAHLKSGPITFVADDAENRTDPAPGGKTAASRKIDEAATIVTVDGERQLPNVLALAPGEFRRDPEFHLPDWTPPPPTEQAAPHRGSAAAGFGHVAAPPSLQRRRGVVHSRPNARPLSSDTVTAFLAAFIPALMGQ